MTKYLYILIGILLVGAAAVFLIGYLVRQPTTSVPNSTSTTGGAQPVNNYTVGVSGGQSQATTSSTQGTQTTQGQSAIAPDIPTAYSSIFVALSAQQVSFNRVQSGNDPTMGSVYALYKSDITIAKKYATQGQDMSLAMASVDLNHDGTAEVLVYEDLPGFCGSGGCELDIYTKSASGWRKLYGILAAGEAGVLNSTTNGYQDLAIGTNTGDNPRSIIGRYTWNGSTYVFAKSLAVWNGQVFIPLK